MSDVGTEEWRGIPGWPQYEVSSAGRVRSLDRKITDSLGRTRTQFGVIKKTWVDNGGYRRVELAHDNRRYGIGVHRLVALAFIGPPAPGQEVRHRDHDPLNNHVSNLSWGTHSENIRDSVADGRHGSRNTKKTHCPEKHPYTGTNARGDRVCRMCRNARQKEYNARKRAASG